MKKRIILVLMFFAVLTFFCGCLQSSESDGTTKADPVETAMQNMTTEEKVGQLFILRPESLGEAYQTGSDKNLKAQLERYPIGGIAIFSANIVNKIQLTMLIADFQKASKLPLFVSVDEEGGKVARIANAPKDSKTSFDVPVFPNMAEIGVTGDPEKARNVGATIGGYLKRLGFNLNFAPVADVNTNPNNIVIGERAFGDSPEAVSKMVKAELEGLHSAGVMGCIKHYPGHGDTAGDTHTGTVVQNKTWDQLLQGELIPFKNAMNNTDMIMTAHIEAINIDPEGLPASLSEVLIQEKLRNELGYQGVVITDSMEMRAVTEQFSSGESAVKAIVAGVDIVLLPQNFEEAYNAVLDAVKTGKISEKRLNESVQRILRLKNKYGML